MSSSDWRPPAPSVIDDGSWSTHFTGRAVERIAGETRIHGYSLLGDLAHHFSHADVVYISIVGEEPTPEASALFAIALTSMSAGTVNESSVHVGVLGRMCGGTLAGALGASAACAADTSRQIVADHDQLLTWLASPQGSPPSQYLTEVPDDVEFGESLRTLLAHKAPNVTLPRALGRRAAQVAMLYQCGFKRGDQMEAAFTFGLWGSLFAEVMMARPADLRSYPALLPPFRYVEGPDER